MRGVERCSALGVRARLVFRLGLARKRDGEDERTRGREDERKRGRGTHATFAQKRVSGFRL